MYRECGAIWGRSCTIRGRDQSMKIDRDREREDYVKKKVFYLENQHVDWAYVLHATPTT